MIHSRKAAIAYALVYSQNTILDVAFFYQRFLLNSNEDFSFHRPQRKIPNVICPYISHLAVSKLVW
jgi:hypothetical protein